MRYLTKDLIDDPFKVFEITVSEDGRIFRKDGREVPVRLDKRGYLRVSLYNKDDKLTYSYMVHRLVAQSYLDNPNDKEVVVNHKDGNKLNNHKDNLEWVTPEDNSKHAYELGIKPFTPRKGGKRGYHGRFVKE